MGTAAHALPHVDTRGKSRPSLPPPYVSPLSLPSLQALPRKPRFREVESLHWVRLEDATLRARELRVHPFCYGVLRAYQGAGRQRKGGSLMRGGP